MGQSGLKRLGVFSLFCCSFYYAMHASYVSASTVKAVTLEEMSQEADTLVQGSVVDESHVLRMHDGKLQPYAVYHIRVDHVFKSSSAEVKEGELIYIDRVGGTFQGLHTIISGSHTYKVGQRLVLFLDQIDQTKHFVAHALKRAVYQVVFDSTLGWIVTQDTRDLIMLNAEHKRLEHGHIERMTLVHMKQRIEKALEEKQSLIQHEHVSTPHQQVITPVHNRGVAP